MPGGPDLLVVESHLVGEMFVDITQQHVPPEGRIGLEDA